MEKTASKLEIPTEHQLYRAYDVAEETDRINSHYDLDPEFYYRFLGGTWHSYSSLYWTRPDMSVTEAEEAKLDLIAEMLELRPGMRILDVGAGWGGPLVYLCKRYGVSGVGLMLSPKQCAAATERAASYGVDAQFQIIHWENFHDQAGFDAVYTDEVAVHFNNLGQFFGHVWTLLRMGGRYLNKEMHYSHERYTTMNRAMEHINGVFGFTGNYRLLHDELTMLHDNGFELDKIRQISIAHYGRTIDGWVSRFFENQKRLEELSDPDFARAFRKYMKLCRIGFNTNTLAMHLLVGKKIDPNSYPWSK